MGADYLTKSQFGTPKTLAERYANRWLTDHCGEAGESVMQSLAEMMVQWRANDRGGDRHGEETGWVIEREDSEPSRPMYYTGLDWDYDNLKAIRFARREDAVALCGYLFPYQPHRIADHMWCP